MPCYRALGPFSFRFRKAEVWIPAGEFAGLPADIGRAAVEQGAAVEVDPEVARLESLAASVAAPAGDWVPVADEADEANAVNNADEARSWSRKRKKEH